MYSKEFLSLVILCLSIVLQTQSLSSIGWYKGEINYKDSSSNLQIISDVSVYSRLSNITMVSGHLMKLINSCHITTTTTSTTRKDFTDNQQIW